MPGEYPPDWDEIATIIKEDAHGCCEHCGHPHDPGHGYCLGVHHIDLDKSNNARYNLVALCQRCHLHFQRPVNLYQLSYFEQPAWLKRYFDGIQSKSEALIT